MPTRVMSLIGAAILAGCPGGDTDIDTDTDTLDPTGTTILSYDDDACAADNGFVRGETSIEDDHWAATRFEPGAFRLTQVGVELYHDPADTDLDCNAELSRAVEVYVASGTTPPSDPTVVASLTIPSGTVAQSPGSRPVTLSLPEAVDVEDGQSVFVAVQMRATSTEATCIRTCSVGGSSDDAFWSHASSPPFDWESYTDIPGLDGLTHWMWIVGTPR